MSPLRGNAVKVQDVENLGARTFGLGRWAKHWVQESTKTPA